MKLAALLFCILFAPLAFALEPVMTDWSALFASGQPLTLAGLPKGYVCWTENALSSDGPKTSAGIMLFTDALVPRASAMVFKGKRSKTDRVNDLFFLLAPLGPEDGEQVATLQKLEYGPFGTPKHRAWRVSFRVAGDYLIAKIAPMGLKNQSPRISYVGARLREYQTGCL
ncbi:MAG TPA: hypothetical protein VFV50_08600 [Bdellovibrionales bacterium]|nr:hypothetical protein [Bdellovibrionales bacterium]